MTNESKSEETNRMNENKTNGNKFIFSGLSYIKNQRNYLIINAIIININF